MSQKTDLDNIILTELNSYDKYLQSSVKDNKEFEYLDHIADKYCFDRKEVIDKSLDVFNWYMRNDVNEYQAKIMSLYKTHEFILRKCLKTI